MYVIKSINSCSTVVLFYLLYNMISSHILESVFAVKLRADEMERRWKHNPDIMFPGGVSLQVTRLVQLLCPGPYAWCWHKHRTRWNIQDQGENLPQLKPLCCDPEEAEGLAWDFGNPLAAPWTPTSYIMHSGRQWCWYLDLVMQSGTFKFWAFLMIKVILHQAL